MRGDMAAAAAPASRLKVLGLQLSNVDCTTVAQRAANCRLARDWILAHPGHDVYVLGELYAVGYSDAVLEALPTLAERLDDGSTPSFFCRLAKDVQAHICFGFVRRGTAKADAFHVCQAVAGPDGRIVAHYDKMHLCQFGDCIEQEYFTSGTDVCTFHVQGFKVGVMVCYDVRFPEMSRCLAWQHGVDVILMPSAFPKDGAFPSWHPFCITRALENQVYLMSISRAGAHFGHSIACPPWLDGGASTPGSLTPRVLGDDAAVLPMVVDRAVLQRVRKEFGFRRDRHPKFGGSGGLRSRL